MLDPQKQNRRAAACTQAPSPARLGGQHSCGANGASVAPCARAGARVALLRARAPRGAAGPQAPADSEPCKALRAVRERPAAAERRAAAPRLQARMLRGADARGLRGAAGRRCCAAAPPLRPPHKKGTLCARPPARHQPRPAALRNDGMRRPGEIGLGWRRQTPEQRREAGTGSSRASVGLGRKRYLC